MRNIFIIILCFPVMFVWMECTFKRVLSINVTSVCPIRVKQYSRPVFTVYCGFISLLTPLAECPDGNNREESPCCFHVSESTKINEKIREWIRYYYIILAEYRYAGRRQLKTIVRLKQCHFFRHILENYTP